MKQKASELADLYEKIWCSNPKNNDSMLENCILQCNKKAHPRGSLRFCAILLAKPLEEKKNLIKMGKQGHAKHVLHLWPPGMVMRQIAVN